jgi:hypothetical protein
MGAAAVQSSGVRGPSDLFLQRRGADGTLHFSLQLGDARDSRHLGLAIDPQGEVIVLGGNGGPPAKELFLTRLGSR